MSRLEETLKKAREEDLGIFLHILGERAEKKAQDIEERKKQGRPLGKLAGIPIVLKDNIAVAGEKCTCASKILENYIAPYSATVVELLDKEDALIIGKTNMDEFAMGGSGKHSAFYPVKNPLDPAYTPGGSSSGSAAAVASGIVPYALGSDTGGSVRQPAAYCGIVGFKPTYGRISRYGLVAFGSSFDQIGIFSQTAKEASAVLEVLGVHCDKDSTSLTAPLKPFKKKQSLMGQTIGVPFSLLEEMDASARAQFEGSVEKLKRLGAEIIPLDLEIFKMGIAVYYILAVAEASTNLARFDGVRYGYRSQNAKTLEEIYTLSRGEGFGFEVKNRILLGTYVLSSGYQDAYFRHAQKVRTLMIQTMRKSFTLCDAIALPTAPGTASKLAEDPDSLTEYLEDLYTLPASITGLPAVSVPAGKAENGMPVGLQIITPATEDMLALEIADVFERGGAK